LGLLFLYGFITILLSFICSILEAVLLSVNQTFIKIKIKEGIKYAENLQKLKNSIDEPLVIILTLNTIAHTVGAIMVGVQAKITYAALNVNNSYTFLGLQITEDTLIGFVSTIMTILILLLSEIIPKTIGARYWDKLAKISTIILMSIIPFFKYTGILWILKFFTKIAGSSNRKSILKREDISTLAEIAEEQGVIKEKDSDFIKNIVKLQNVKLREIMTPFSVIKSADMNSSIEEFYSNNQKLPFSRIPIYSKNEENIDNYVLKDTILEKLIQKKGKNKLKDIKRPIIKISYESKIPVLFDKLLKKREHISLVIDEFGAIRGIVTLEDIIETLLGLEIVDETDTVVDLQLFAKNKRKKYLKDIN
jgi:CBS domain containing-hemolysin-like protein